MLEFKPICSKIKRRNLLVYDQMHHMKCISYNIYYVSLYFWYDNFENDKFKVASLVVICLIVIGESDKFKLVSPSERQGLYMFNTYYSLESQKVVFLALTLKDGCYLASLTHIPVEIRQAQNKLSTIFTAREHIIIFREK